MEELMGMFAGMGGTGYGADDLLVDGGIVAAVNEMTNWLKERLKEWTWDDPFERYTPVIPFLCAFALCFLMAGMPLTMDGMMSVGKQSIMYGTAAISGFALYKTTVKGE